MKIDVILEAGLPAQQVVALAVQAEAIGIQTLWVSGFPSRRDPVPALTLASQATRHIRLATLPVSPYEMHPLRIADQLLTLNELSNGRAGILIGGLGHSVMRVTGLEPRRRITAVCDTLTILKNMNSQQALQYRGEMFSLTDYRAEWATRHAPFIYAGATFEKMLTMAAGVADGTMLSDAPLGRMPEIMRWIDSGLTNGRRQRKDFRVNNFMAWHVKKDKAIAVAEARRELIWRGFLLPWFTETFLDAATAKAVEAAKPAFLRAFLARSARIDGVPDEVVNKLVDQLTLTGDVSDIDAIAAKIAALGAAGLDEVALRLHDQPEQSLQMIGDLLLPALGIRPGVG
jgi:alkanesulfonate monooxygenase SsuD/methylene tetrahydromethanopterin reductase-like flavin-dependent oxidoreductase (luciferase family)